MDLIDQLRIFIKVANSGGFTPAAAQLGMPRPTVSLAIQRLEARLGTRLLHRTTRCVRLTRDGQSLLARANTLVSDADELEQLFHTHSATIEGHLRVDAPSRIARRVIAPALPGFFAQYPKVSLELGASDRAVDLVREGVDCALRVGEVTPNNLVLRPLGQLTLVNCASPAYLERFGIPRAPADLVHHQAVHYASGNGGVEPWEWQHSGKTHTQTMAGQVTVNNAESYIACALAGLELIQVPAFDVHDHLAKGELIAVLKNWQAPAMPIQLVYPHRHPSRRLQAFNNWLAAQVMPLTASSAH